MLARQRPFDAGYDQAVLYAILNQDPVPISDHRDDIPEPIADLTTSLLMKSPLGRPSTAADVAAILVPHAGSMTHTGNTSGSRTSSADTSAADTSTAETSAAPPNRRMVMLAGLAGFAVLALLAVFLIRDNRSDSVATVLNDNNIAIFPFAINGDPSLEYLSEGFVNLLGTKLNGAGDLTTVDPNALIGLVAQRKTDAIITPSEAQEMAAGLGAGSFILGSVTKLADDIQLDAAIYRSTDTSRVRVSIQGESQLPAGVDQLARELVAPIIEAGTGQLQSVAAVTTTSFEALKAYLEGERHLRNMDTDEAHDAFERSVQADSTFALGWYRFARAIRWGGGSYSTGARIDARRDALDRALENRDQLPDRHQILIRAADAFERGRLEEATELYARRIEQDNNDLEALMEYGDLLYAYNPLFGRSAQDARPILQRVIELDSDNPLALYLLRTLALIRGDRESVYEITEKQIALLDDEANENLRADVSFHRTLFEDDDSLWAVFESLPSAGTKIHYASDLAFDVGSWDIGEQMLDALDSSEYSEQTRDYVRWEKAALLNMRGRPEYADEVAGKGGTAEAEVLVDRVLRDAIPSFSAPKNRLEELRDLVIAWDTVNVTLRPASVNSGHYGELILIIKSTICRGAQTVM
jgi:tetratricopeptide (TPR) repeat protein